MTAKELRIQWQREFGLSEEEIEEDLNRMPPNDIIEEQRQLDSVRRLQQMDTSWISPVYRSILKENGYPEDAGYMVCFACRKLVKYDDKGDGYCECHNVDPEDRGDTYVKPKKIAATLTLSKQEIKHLQWAMRTLEKTLLSGSRDYNIEEISENISNKLNIALEGIEE